MFSCSSIETSNKKRNVGSNNSRIHSKQKREIVINFDETTTQDRAGEMLRIALLSIIKSKCAEHRDGDWNVYLNEGGRKASMLRETNVKISDSKVMLLPYVCP